MASLTDYFNRIGYKCKYYLGDRVHGVWNKVPFMGTVGNDRCIDGKNPEVIVHLDLPIILDKKVNNFIIVKHKDIKGYLKEIK
jgi:hypothetical protein